MNAYELILEKLNEKIEYGELTIEQAEEVNELAYEKYVLEAKDEDTLSKAEAKEIVVSLLDVLQNHALSRSQEKQLAACEEVLGSSNKQIVSAWESQKAWKSKNGSKASKIASIALGITAAALAGTATGIGIKYNKDKNKALNDLRNIKKEKMRNEEPDDPDFASKQEKLMKYTPIQYLKNHGKVVL